MGGKGTHRQCVICGIRERHKGGRTLLFASFPLDETRCKEWVRVIGNEDLVHIPIIKLRQLRHVCGDHFEKRDLNKKGTRTKSHAVPRLNLSALPLTDNQLIGFPLPVHKDNKDLEQHLTGDTSHESMNRPHPKQHEKVIVAERRKSEENTGPSPRKKVLLDISNVQRTSVLEPVASTSTSGHEQNIHHGPSSRKKVYGGNVEATASSTDVLCTLLLDISNVQRTSVLEPVASTSTSGHEQNIDHGPSPRKKVLLDISNVQTTSVLEPVASTSTSGHEQNIHHGPSPRKKVLLEISNVQTTSVLEPVASTSTSGHEQNIHHGLAHTKITSGLQANKENFKRNTHSLESSSKEAKLIEELRKTKCTLRALKKSAKLIENIESDVLKGFVLAAFQNQQRKPQGRRWTPQNKISALAIYKRSPKTYRYMAHTMPLPSVRTLQNLLKKVPMDTGINKSVLAHLSKKSEKIRKNDKFCSLLFDEIALKRRLHFDPAADKIEGFEDYGGGERTKEMADHALVFMLQGVRAKFKMPLAYYFTKGTVSSQKLSAIIKEIITAVEATGYTIIATVCDQGPTNVGAMGLLKAGQSPEETSFFTCGNEKVYTIFDVPHLFKSVRNNFLNNGVLVLGDKKAKWAHLVKMEEKNRQMLYLTAITQSSVQPKYRAKMKVKLAAQLFSRKVSAVLKLMSEAEKSPDAAKEMRETGEIIFELDRLFDFTNGPSGPAEVKKGIRENVSSRTDHLNVWAEFRKKLNTVKFLNSKGEEAKHVKCVQGYVITLSALQDLWHKLRSEGFKYLNLRQLNQDALENLFGVIRQHSPTNRNPTCSNFVGALKASIISRLTAPHSRGANCDKDYQELLTDFREILFAEDHIDNSSKPVESRIPETIEEMDDEFFPVLSIPEETEFEEIESNLADLEQQPIVYVSGFIAANLLKRFQGCSICEEALRVNNPSDDPIYSYISLREWWPNKTSLTYPTIELCRLVETAVKAFETEIVPCLYYLCICKLTVILFYTKCDASFLKCEAHRKKILDLLYFRLGCLLLRRQCQRTNQGLAMKEESLSDACKKAQQHGAAK